MASYADPGPDYCAIARKGQGPPCKKQCASCKKWWPLERSNSVRAKVSKTFRFEASHHLPNHDGKCRNEHGHSYRVVVECEGRINVQDGHPKEGMVLDFADIKDVWEDKIRPCTDHQDLNTTLVLVATTAECIAWWILDVLCSAGLPVTEVTVWETETSSATVTFSETWKNGGPNVGVNSSRVENQGLENVSSS